MAARRKGGRVKLEPDVLDGPLDEQQVRQLAAEMLKSHPNREAVETLLSAMTESIALRRRLDDIAKRPLAEITEAEWREVELIERLARSAKRRMSAAFEDLEATAQPQ
jgi:hypothetical protein